LLYYTMSATYSHTQQALERAMRTRDLETAEDILESYELDEPVFAIESAVQQRDLDGLKFLIKAGLWCPHAITNAAQHNNVQGLQLLIAAGFPIKAEAVVAAAKHGHFVCLDMLIKAGCPVPWFASQQALQLGHLDCFDLLVGVGGQQLVDREGVVTTIVDTGVVLQEEVHKHRYNDWTDDQLNSGIARKCIWTMNLTKYPRLASRIDWIKAEKAETTNMVMQSLSSKLPLDVVKHVLCLYL